MASAETLYSPQVLALATSLAAYPLRPEHNLRTVARSRSCGSQIELGLAVDEQGQIHSLGIKAQACAIGQAAAAIFIAAATGCNKTDIGIAMTSIEHWLSAEGDLPDWPSLQTIASARDYTGRHGAILLSWQAANELLSTRD